MPDRRRAPIIAAIDLGLAFAIGFTGEAVAQQDPVIAVDIALEPDATMLQHAKDANARLLKSFPKGFALDETHHPHVTMVQQFVRTADLEKVFAAASVVVAKENRRHGSSRHSKIITYRRRRSVSRGSSSNRRTICTGFRMNSSRRSPPTR